MDEELDAQLATGATALVVLLLFGQVGLMTATVWSPMARAADRLIGNENAPLYQGPDVVSRRAPNDPAAEPHGAWRWAAIAMSGAGAALGLFAGWRVYDGSAQRNRWLAVLVVAGLVAAWGLFTFRLITRAPTVFEGL